MAPDRRIALVSVSIDLGAGRRGVDMGPSALRIAGISSRVEALGYQIREFGTVTAGGFETTDPGPERETRFLEEIAQVADRAAAMVREALDEGCLPLILGGDHSLSIGTVGAVAAHHRSRDASVGVIWVDAHTDMNTPESTPSGNIHGLPAIRPENVTVLGAREVDPGERQLIRSMGVRVFTMSEIDERGIGPCMDEALERASDGTAGFHLSFDLDALDPLEAPGVGTPVPGGLTYREGHLVCEKAAASGDMLSLELVELNPVLDDRNHTANLAVGLVTSALGKSIL